MADIRFSRQGDWLDLGLGRKGNHPSAFICLEQGSRMFDHTDSGVTVAPTHEDILNCNHQPNVESMGEVTEEWGRRESTLLEVIPVLQQNIGSSTVAIDNKIEQAMDLVKSHLMFAVREEVEVLKEQIKELIEKNSQLEYENSILKAAASQETLAKLSQPRPQPPTSSS